MVAFRLLLVVAAAARGASALEARHDKGLELRAALPRGAPAVALRGGETVFSALSHAAKINVAASFAAGGLALYDMREELLELGHHHGLLLIVLSRLARTFAGLEGLALSVRAGLETRAGFLQRALLNHRTLRLLCVFAMVASGYEVWEDAKPGGHHGMLLLSVHELQEVSEEVVGEGQSLLQRALAHPLLKLALAAGALAFACFEFAEDVSAKPGAHHGVAAIALGHVVKGLGEVYSDFAEAKEAKAD